MKSATTICVWLTAVLTIPPLFPHNAFAEENKKPSAYASWFLSQKQAVTNEALAAIKTKAMFKDVDLSKLHFAKAFFAPDGDLVIYGILKTAMNIGGHTYPQDSVIDAESSDIVRIFLADKITINGIKICGQLGQHAQTLEIFEIKLCEDSEINGMKIPGGSFVSFIKGDLKKGQRWHEVGCISPGAKMHFKGRTFHKGSILLPRSKDGTVEDPEKVSSCEVQVWESPKND